MADQNQEAWPPIVAGIDDSPESVFAARVAASIAQRTGAKCLFVHAARDVWATVKRISAVAAATASATPIAESHFDEMLSSAARVKIESWLNQHLPSGVEYELRVLLGNAPATLEKVVSEAEAALVVLGGKQHLALQRWFGGSTAQHMARTADVPILVVSADAAPIRRVLVAVDFTPLAGETIRWAERFARLDGAALRVLHVVELLPTDPELGLRMHQEEFYRVSSEICEESLWPLTSMTDAEHVVRQGSLAATIEAEVKDWTADLLVVGTHGKSWANRLILGSTTDTLLNDLPATTLVIPPPASNDAPPGASTSTPRAANARIVV